MLDKMYEMNLVYFKELTMYILAGKKKLAEVRANELPQTVSKHNGRESNFILLWMQLIGNTHHPAKSPTGWIFHGPVAMA